MKVIDKRKFGLRKRFKNLNVIVFYIIYEKFIEFSI